MTTQLSDAELQSILDFSIGLARRAGEVMLEGSEKIRESGATDEKKNSVDLVTEYDVKVEKLVMGELEKKYPTFKFIGEETFAAEGMKRPEMTDEPTFCVDPIDGTTNFVHGFPHACISLGLIVNKRPVLGVIYNPFLDQLYTGLKGHGSFLSSPHSSVAALAAPRRLPLARPRPLPSLGQALIGIEWGSDRSKEMVDKKGDSFKLLAGNPKEGVVGGKMAHSLRSYGSAALNYAMVAQGGLDMYWEIGCWPWDICAGAIIAQEAGGFVAGSHSAPLDNDVNEDVLWGRKHIVLRAIGDTETEKGIDAQKRIIREFYETVADFDPK
ncbi:myo inositol monophosphatase [Dichomitus squalens]|uniref:Inositol-1-monophosphatase n=1 Tax=Dichomitus squalens TaxID=114155 RepID=A0A4Q9NNC6_9APHY|nr:myo inositol monophosphatase [Dichomitus squalens LYAD-421 SS1]EJF67475.1 myo inositol monophosphatase [Dichomitus squalens LYAD-421 SS1]TBU42558.1 myo inositol monophosphatase [Dichomitus squalens]TBU58115.1 myo inositol monophosphatase [Dichomitus squalens]